MVSNFWLARWFITLNIRVFFNCSVPSFRFISEFIIFHIALGLLFDFMILSGLFCFLVNVILRLYSFITSRFFILCPPSPVHYIWFGQINCFDSLVKLLSYSRFGCYSSSYCGMENRYALLSACWRMWGKLL